MEYGTLDNFEGENAAIRQFKLFWTPGVNQLEAQGAWL